MVCGDGGFQMTGQALGTMVRLRQNTIVVFVVDNGLYGYEQYLLGRSYYTNQTEAPLPYAVLTPRDYEGFARAMGVGQVSRADNVATLRTALASAKAHTGGPSFIHALVTVAVPASRAVSGRRADTLGPVNLDGNQASIREAVDAGLLAGAVTLVWQAGEVLQVNEIGYRDVDARLPMQRDTLFRIASMTKPVTVAAAMALLEEGKFALTDPVAKWLPELANMRVLLDTAGPLDKTEPAPAADHVRRSDDAPQRPGLRVLGGRPAGPRLRKVSQRQEQDRWLAELAELPLAHQPGERLTYSHATDVLGIALSRIEGKPLADVLAERIFEPLGMSDTGFSVGPTGRQRAATMYQLDDDNVLRHDVMGPAPITDPPFCSGGAGLWSTADDYLRFARMLLAGGTSTGCGCSPRSRCD